MKIDVVITWVNGEDPVHKAKRSKYGSKNIFMAEDIGADTRFSSLGEIFWCVASINLYAQFVNKIFIVTDDQNPHLEPFLKKNFPQGYIPFEIVDHKTIFRGYEQYLPTFNSRAIETMTWRIPGLSENFIEMNDDFIFCSPAQVSDFYTPDNKIICYASWASVHLTKLSRKLKRNDHGLKRATYKGAMVNAAHMVNYNYFYLRLNHTPRALKKSVFENYFANHPQDIIRNIQYKFRNQNQYIPKELYFLLMHKRGDCVVKSPGDVLFFLQPKPKAGYVENKLSKLTKESKYKYCCFNSVDMANEKERELIISKVEEVLGFKFR